MSLISSLLVSFFVAILRIGILAGPEPVDIFRFHVLHASLKAVFSRVQLMYRHCIIIIWNAQGVPQ